MHLEVGVRQLCARNPMRGWTIITILPISQKSVKQLFGKVTLGYRTALFKLVPPRLGVFTRVSHRLSRSYLGRRSLFGVLAQYFKSTILT